jgi:hypothetical protein
MEHGVARGNQRRHPQAGVGLDPDLNLCVRALFRQVHVLLDGSYGLAARGRCEPDQAA